MEARIFHADDWGMSPAINEGILELACRGTLRSASLMANAEHLSHALSDLLAFSEVDLYLHFNLTYGSGLPSHRKLMWLAVTGQLPEGFVEAELLAQLKRLEDVGATPKGLNGHHHVHALPGVADGVLDALARRPELELLLLSDPEHRPSYWQSAWFCWRHRSRLKGLTVRHCRYLRPRHLRSSAALKNKITATRAADLPLLVHPALWDDFASSGMRDRLTNYRVTELKMILESLHA